MTSFIAAGGSGRSTSVIPAVPAASSVTTIAFIQDLLYPVLACTAFGAAALAAPVRVGEGMGAPRSTSKQRGGSTDTRSRARTVDGLDVYAGHLHHAASS